MLSRLIGGALRGAAAGAAGTTALNTATYLDMALRARPASSTPEQTVDKLAQAAGTEVPGEGEDRDNRLTGLGALSGIVAGVGTGAALGALRPLGLRPGPLLSTVLATGGVMVGTIAPMAALGITDPRSWDTQAWVSDVVPHAAYGLVTASTLAALERG